MAIAKGQETGRIGGANVASQAGNMGSTPTPGSLVVVAISGWHASGFEMAAGGVTDNQGNTYTLAIQSALETTIRSAIFYAMNIAASGTFTVTVDPVAASANYFHFTATEFTGMATASALDQVISNTNALSDNPNTGNSSATTLADELVLACTTVVGGSDVGLDVPATTGFTNLSVEQDSSVIIGHASDYKIVSATGVQSAAWGTLVFTYPWTAALATFKASGGAGPSGAPRYAGHLLKLFGA